MSCDVSPVAMFIVIGMHWYSHLSCICHCQVRPQEKITMGKGEEQQQQECRNCVFQQVDDTAAHNHTHPKFGLTLNGFPFGKNCCCKYMFLISIQWISLSVNPRQCYLVKNGTLQMKEQCYLKSLISMLIFGPETNDILWFSDCVNAIP